MRRAVITAAAVAMTALAGGCRGQTSEDSPILLLRDMFHQQRFNPQSENTVFADRRSDRPILADTVSHEDPLYDDRVGLGLEEDRRTFVPTVPTEVVEAGHGMEQLLARGRERYGIYCTPCHGITGDGNGTVFERSHSAGYTFPQPASLNQDRVRQMPDGQLYATISNGVRNMPAYSFQIPVQDRWAIVAYVRALELSQAPGAAQ